MVPFADILISGCPGDLFPTRCTTIWWCSYGWRSGNKPSSQLHFHVDGLHAKQLAKKMNLRKIIFSIFRCTAEFVFSIDTRSIEPKKQYAYVRHQVYPGTWHTSTACTTSVSARGNQPPGCTSTAVPVRRQIEERQLWHLLLACWCRCCSTFSTPNCARVRRLYTYFEVYRNSLQQSEVCRGYLHVHVGLGETLSPIIDLAYCSTCLPGTRYSVQNSKRFAQSCIELRTYSCPVWGWQQSTWNFILVLILIV